MYMDIAWCISLVLDFICMCYWYVFIFHFVWLIRYLYKNFLWPFLTLQLFPITSIHILTAKFLVEPTDHYHILLYCVYYTKMSKIIACQFSQLLRPHSLRVVRRVYYYILTSIFFSCYKKYRGPCLTQHNFY